MLRDVIAESVPTFANQLQKCKNRKFIPNFTKHGHFASQDDASFFLVFEEPRILRRRSQQQPTRFQFRADAQPINGTPADVWRVRTKRAYTVRYVWDKTVTAGLYTGKRRGVTRRPRACWWLVFRSSVKEPHIVLIVAVIRGRVLPRSSVYFVAFILDFFPKIPYVITNRWGLEGVFKVDAVRLLAEGGSARPIFSTFPGFSAHVESRKCFID